MKPPVQLRVMRDGLASVKEIAEKYCISKSTLYELIRADPTFPYTNVGLKKKFMIHMTEFEKWLNTRTAKHKEERFGLRTASGVLERLRK